MSLYCNNKAMAHPQSAIENPVKRSINLWSVFWSLVWIFLIILAGLRLFVYQQVNVVGSSMEPNYHNHERLVVNRRNKSFVRGQVVAVYADKEIAKNANYFTPYDSQTTFYLKRIIGLPGEEIEIIGSSVIIYSSEYPDGRVLVEDYVDPTVKNREEVAKYYFPRTKINDSEYFVLGDNRANSTDSRREGNFPEYAIFGQETFRYWPIARASLFEPPDYSFERVSLELEQKREEYRTVVGRTRFQI